MRGLPKLVVAIWMGLIVSIAGSLYVGSWDTVLVSSLTLILTILPIAFANRFEVKLPTRFAVAIIVFVFATMFLGEVEGFYERFWWWDVLLHGGSAVALGLFGFLCIFMLFEGDRFAAPPIALAILSFCFAVAVGAVWEIFEFTMDRYFGSNMQKSGLVDTMWDLVVDCAGGLIGSLSGYLYLLKRRGYGVFAGWFDAFIERNKSHFKKFQR
ncbi:MAG: hypothetical protein ACSHYB_01695 [Roseibacillus sp.]